MSCRSGRNGFKVGEFFQEMDPLYENIIRPALFTQDPETMHELALRAMTIVGAVPPLRAAMEYFNLIKTPKQIKIFGLEFPNRVGLAAGFDKDAYAWRGAAAMGFGHVEIGTVSMLKQAGNPRPRMFRYPSSEAIVNGCGFPNDGAEQIAARLSKVLGKRRDITKKCPLGINIGKSKITPLEEAAADYLFSFSALADFADFFTINVSSPNTPELRRLQGRDFLPNLLGAISKANEDRAKKLGVARIPIILKIAPDLSFEDIDAILSILEELKLDGICATNTTVSRPADRPEYEKTGGLSGKPLFEKSLEIVRYISKATDGKLPIIGVGGITDVRRSGEMMNAGASLVQIYSGMIYRGPFFARSIANSLIWRDSDWV